MRLGICCGQSNRLPEFHLRFGEKALSQQLMSAIDMELSVSLGIGFGQALLSSGVELQGEQAE